MVSDRDRIVALHLRLALLALGLALTFGAMSVLHYLPSASVALQSLGLGLAQLRPLHTTFAHTWIYVANIALIYSFLALQRQDGLDDADRKRFVFHTVCWVVGGGGVLLTLLLGVTSGRVRRCQKRRSEYLPDAVNRTDQLFHLVDRSRLGKVDITGRVGEGVWTRPQRPS